MLQAVIEKGVTQENVSALKELTALYERMQDRDAKKDFVTALMDFQNEAKKVKATKPVPNKDGTVRYMFAPFQDLMDQVQPLAQKNGFIITFSEGPSVPAKVTSICRLTHRSGHSQENQYSVRIGRGPPGASETQADGSAHMYSKRGALMDALNIVIDKRMDDDAALLGAEITPGMAESLRQRVRDTASDETAFLRYAHGKSYGPKSTFETIPVAMYDALDQNLRRKEKP